jgi:hypothetical protein
MTDSKISTLSTFIDKFELSKIFNKVDFIKNCAIGVALFTFASCIITIENYRINLYIKNKLVEKINKKNESILKKQDEIIIISNKILSILNKHDEILEDILATPSLNLINKEIITRTLSNVSSLSDEFQNIENKIDYSSSELTEKQEQEDLELINECYDVLPCNNSKKVTGLNRLFGWK